jgi:hypothetical protein
MDVDVSKTGKLIFLLDTGADISLIKCTTLVGTTEYDPNQRIKVKCEDGAVVETHGIVEACVGDGKLKIPFNVHLVSTQVDLAYDGILGRDFLRHTTAQICYEGNRVIFRKGDRELTKRILRIETVQERANTKIYDYLGDRRSS